MRRTEIVTMLSIHKPTKRFNTASRGILWFPDKFGLRKLGLHDGEVGCDRAALGPWFNSELIRIWDVTSVPVPPGGRVETEKCRVRVVRSRERDYALGNTFPCPKRDSMALLLYLSSRLGVGQSTMGVLLRLRL